MILCMPVPVVAAVGGAVTRRVASGGARATVGRAVVARNIVRREDANGELPDSTQIKKVTLLSYSSLFFVAGFKDIMDLVGIGSLPGIGTIVTICCSILIFFLMILTGKFRAQKAYRRALVLMFGTMVEAFGFGLNFMPIETFTIAAMYSMEKAESPGGTLGMATKMIQKKI